MSDAGLLVIMGSGETTPTMVSTHQRVLAAVGPDPDAVLLDTPYGFQENAEQITARALTYFHHNVGHAVRAEPLGRVQDAPPGRVEAVTARVAAADWVFAGPGSPSYLLRQWRATRLPEVLAERIAARRGATVFASAAAVTLGSHAIPVYEVYKAGEDPVWLEGLDLLSPVGLPAVVIPHYDNAEGGTHDTRYCYLGERRLRRLEEELPVDAVILGVDEHTAAVLDLTTREVRIEGRGRLTVRRHGVSRHYQAGATVSLDELHAAAQGLGAGAATAPPPAPPVDHDDRPPAAASPLLELVAELGRRFDARLRGGDAMGAVEAALELQTALGEWSGDTLQSDQLDRATDTLRSMIVRLGQAAAAGLHDHRQLLAPHVEALLDLRARARDRGDYDLSDRIRDALAAGGVEVRDTPDGTVWDHPDAGGPATA